MKSLLVKMASGWLDTILVTVVALRPITNPISTPALFLSITAGDGEERRRAQALKGAIYAFLVLAVFLIAGTLIMNFFGISLPGLRIAGGVMVIRIAMSMLSAQSEVAEDTKREARVKEDISFTPLAMPSLSGPGAIAVTIGLSAGTEHWIEYTAIVAGILAVVTVAYITLRASDQIVRFLGAAGINALSKIMGFLLLCVGIQFLIDATLKIVTDPELLEQLARVYGQATGTT